LLLQRYLRYFWRETKQFKNRSHGSYLYMVFTDRREAGKKLAGRLQHYANQEDVLVLALPRGGVPVAFEVAQKLQVPLDIFIVRKLGLPGQEELAIGAIASGGTLVLNESLVNQLRLSRATIDSITEREEEELARREELYRRGRRAHSLAGKKIILVDDGLATGASMKAAALAIKDYSPAKVIVAVPVAAAETCVEFQKLVDEVICFTTPDPFWAVGNWYANFTQTTDKEVENLLNEAAKLEEKEANKRDKQ